ncbi:PPOX class F420-dependent oxidoreductase [Sphaerobacter thermophilus]|uniref:PPOX class putative F420-dependent enzyme n=1 Tax=Sphaerobacter thermophilus (strain ATCC 49802 / DSM 20745 / KCCM 41009 / NCIMB 13125 / S 6022) TaxID=479434 RepID=D1CAW9_SPHTD|nr:PPOX class F420-dependent oxidoreductase [Sphaerobacter thermophilus]ACZ39916.1 PPOX class putative F420-dependent enzyme [Sphaerobacter thermophilus DSM 20745]
MMSEAVRAFLNEPRFAVLATIGADGAPHQSVMWYELRGNTIMMNTSEGRVKSANLRRDPRVSICVEDGYRYVTITGRAELVDDQEIAQADIAALAHRYHDPETAERQVAEFRRQKRITLHISIDRVSAHGF